jgi:hypothetical protein
MQIKLLGITNVDSDVIGQRLIRFSTGEKVGVQRYNTSAIYRFQESL